MDNAHPSLSKRFAPLLALSIAALLPLVNASAESLTPVNPPSTKETAEFSRLVKMILKTGDNGDFKKNIAPAIGLDKPAPTKVKEFQIGGNANSNEYRACSVVLNDSIEKESKTPDRPKCVYLAWRKVDLGKSATQYYKVSLNGLLEKAVTITGTIDKDGKIARGSGQKIDQDINSPEVRKVFDSEMAYWLKDWLKKEQAAHTKKQAAVAMPAAAASL